MSASYYVVWRIFSLYITYRGFHLSFCAIGSFSFFSTRYFTAYITKQKAPKSSFGKSLKRCVVSPSLPRLCLGKTYTKKRHRPNGGGLFPHRLSWRFTPHLPLAILFFFSLSQVINSGQILLAPTIGKTIVHRPILLPNSLLFHL